MSPATSSPNCNRTTTISATTVRASNSILRYPPFLLTRCLFKSRMRIPKKPVSFCLSLFSPEFTHSFSSRVKFHSVYLRVPDHSFGKRREFHTRVIQWTGVMELILMRIHHNFTILVAVMAYGTHIFGHHLREGAKLNWGNRSSATDH